MNRNQWFVLGIGSILLGVLMSILARSWDSCMASQGDLMIKMIYCIVRKYAYAVPTMISLFLGMMFIICGFLEPKKK